MMHWVKLGAMSAVVMGLVMGAAGCPGNEDCGVGPDGDNPNVNQDGTVQFTPTKVGESQTLTIPMQDSADTDEVIVAASLSGDDAASFKVLSTFPMNVPAGTSVNVDVEFVPTKVGSMSATLVLETQAMGPSPVALLGIGSAPE